MGNGVFITFEGGEGSGKSTQAVYLRDRLVRRGIPCRLIREPGGTPLGNRLRRLLKFSNIPITVEAELLLFSASRTQLVTDVIKPSLARGEVVVCDRFYDSTVAYQGHGRGISIRYIDLLNSIVAQGEVPDLTIFLDIKPEQGMIRLSSSKDRFEQGMEHTDGKDFHRRVYESYVHMSGESERWMRVDANLSRKEISGLIWRRVQSLVEF